MARVLGVDLPNEKHALIGLTYLYGIGRTRAKQILEETGIPFDKKIKDLSDNEIRSITQYINSHFKVEGELKQEVQRNVKRLIEIGSYRGLRHRQGLPVRGQRTKTNARTRKGPSHGIKGK